MLLTGKSHCPQILSLGLRTAQLLPLCKNALQTYHEPSTEWSEESAWSQPSEKDSHAENAESVRGLRERGEEKEEGIQMSGVAYIHKSSELGDRLGMISCNIPILETE